MFISPCLCHQHIFLFLNYYFFKNFTTIYAICYGAIHSQVMWRKRKASVSDVMRAAGAGRVALAGPRLDQALGHGRGRRQLRQGEPSTNTNFFKPCASCLEC